MRPVTLFWIPSPEWDVISSKLVKNFQFSRFYSVVSIMCCIIVCRIRLTLVMDGMKNMANVLRMHL